MELSPRIRLSALVPFLGVASLLGAACNRAPSEQNSSAATATTNRSAVDEAKAQSASAASALAASKVAAAQQRKAKLEALQRARKPREVTAKPVAKVPASPGDPEKGEFTLTEATRGLSGEGKLIADIVTDAGTLSCELYEEKAPITVANFVGLARGLRAWNKDGKWVKQPLYDGTKFHRIIKGFMIQGGDPAGNGSGGPGYVIPDEIWADAHHDAVGQLCMANRGPNTNGSQFFIMDGVAPHLDGGYTIFGQCTPESVVRALSGTNVQGERPAKAPTIQKVTVKREAKEAAASSTASAAEATDGTKPGAPAPGAK